MTLDKELALNEADNCLLNGDSIFAVLYYGLAADYDGLMNFKDLLEDIKQEHDFLQDYEYTACSEILNSYFREGMLISEEECISNTLSKIKAYHEGLEPDKILRFFEVLNDKNELLTLGNDFLKIGQLELAIRAYKSADDDIRKHENELMQCFETCLEDGMIIEAVKALNLAGKDTKDYKDEFLKHAEELEQIPLSNREELEIIYKILKD